MPVERVALRLGDALVGQVVAEVGAAGHVERVVVADHVLRRAAHEGDLLAVVEAGDAAHRPQHVVGRRRHPVLAAEAVAEVVVGADVVVLQEGDQRRRIAVDPVHRHRLGDALVVAAADVVAERREQAEVEHGEAEVAAGVGVARIVAEPGVPPRPDRRRAVVAAAHVAPAVALDQVLAEDEQPRLVRLPGVDVLEQVVALDVLDGVEADARRRPCRGSG